MDCWVVDTMKTFVQFAKLRLVVVFFYIVCSVSRASGTNKSAFDIDEEYRKASTDELKILSRWLEAEGGDIVPKHSQCPPPIRPLSPASCDVFRCSDDKQCASKINNTYVCCFNGCIKTCLRAVDPPPVIDWIDEPPNFNTFIVPGRAEHSSAPEVVAIAGGCLITSTQYERLQSFKSNKHITDCFCAVGGVFCEVSKL